MRKLKTMMTLLLVTVWSLAMHHCQLETLPHLDFLGCSVETAAATHCNDTACASLENSFYKAEKQQSTPSARLVLIDFATSAVLPELSHTATADIARVDAMPPELPRRWQFVFRTAAPPRAPSLVS